MNYGLTVYGPFEGEPSEVSALQTNLYDLLRATPRQAHTVVETMRAYSDFRTVTVAARVSSFKERLHALVNSRSLGEVVVDLACYRRLEALRDRMVEEDPQLATEEDALQHVAYAALMSGLQALEAEAGVRYDDNTGIKL